MLASTRAKFASPPRLRRGLALGVGLVAAISSVALRTALTPFLGGEERFVAMFPALLLASYYGGLAGGGACLLASVLGDWYFFVGEPRSFALAPHEAAGLAALFASGGAIVAGVVAIRRLIHRLEAAREAEQLLARELQHRVKNNLSVIEALAVTSARGADDLAGFLERFLSRMQSLSAAQMLLSRDSVGSPQVEEVVAAVLAPFQASGRLAWSGDRLWLDSAQAVSLALCLHELATNAVKYGALASGEGEVRIAWSRLDAGRAAIRWEERGPDPVSEPSRIGSGVRLLRRGLELQSPCEISYGPDGVRWLASFHPAR